MILITPTPDAELPRQHCYISNCASKGHYHIPSREDQQLLKRYNADYDTLVYGKGIDTEDNQ